MKKFFRSLTAFVALGIATLGAGHVPAHAADYDQCFEGRAGVGYRRCLQAAEIAFGLCKWKTGRELRCRIQFSRRKVGCRQRYCVIRAPVTPRP